MTKKRRLILLTAALAVVSTAVIGVTVLLLYDTSFEQQRVRLCDTVRSQASLIRAMARHDQASAAKAKVADGGNDPFEETLSQLRESHDYFGGIGKTGEFTLAKREKDKIVFLLSHRYYDFDEMQAVLFSSTKAEPMRRALNGESGSVVGLDYRGEQVLAGYQPIAELGLGLVAKIDLSEIREPFIRAGLTAGAITIALIFFGTLLFYRIDKPMVRDLIEREAQLRDITTTIPRCLYQLILHEDGRVSIPYLNRAFEELTGIDTHDMTQSVNSLFDVIHDDDVASFKESIRRAAKAMSAWDHDFRIITTCRGIIWLNSGAKPRRLRNGSILWNGVLTDITERRKAQEKADRLAAFPNHNPAPVLRTDMEGDIILVNAAAEDLLDTNLTGKAIASVLTGVADFFRTPMTAPRQFEEILGDEVYLFSVVKSTPTQSVYFYGSNITEHKQLEEKLTQSEATFKAISSSAKDAIVMMDNDGNVSFWNDAAESIFGVTEDEVRGRNFHDMFVPDKYLDQHETAFKTFRKTGEGPLIGCTCEVVARRKDGTEFPTEVSLSKVSLNGKWHAIGIVRDITKRKKDEEELRKLSFAIEQSDNAVIITNTDGLIEYVNPKFTESSGFTADEAIGQNPRILKSGNAPDETYVELWETISSGGIWSGEFHNKRKCGELYWDKTTISPITDTSGSIISYLAIKEDITEQKKLEKERQGLAIEMNQARKLEAVGSLAAGIAHEINTPIQFVGDNTNFLSDSFESLISLIESYECLWKEAQDGGDLSDLESKRVSAEHEADLGFLRGEVPTAIGQTLDGVQRVTRIVRAMKDFAHSDQGTKSMSDLNDMLESTLTVTHNELKYVADIEINFDRDLPEIECYRDDLNQVFLNLLVNAAHTIADVIDDGTATKGVITVSTHHDGDEVIVRISDTGKGIPESIQDRVFDPFFSTKDVGKGSGQGLSIARKIVVEKHDGYLDFETEQGKGTTFIIRLPVRVHNKAAGVA